MRSLANRVIAPRRHGLALAVAVAAAALGLSAPAARADHYLARQTLYQWDAANRMTMKIWPAPTDGGVRRAEKYVYTQDGRLQTVMVGQVTNELGANFIALETRSFAYDAVGNTTSVTTPSGVTQFSYDGADHVVCTAMRMNGVLGVDACAPAVTGTDTPDRITKSVHDAAGQVTSTIQALGVAGVQRTYATYTYSKNGKQRSITDDVGNLTELGYDGFDRLTLQTFPSPIRGAHAVNTGDYEGYEYDKAGNRTALRKRDGSRIEYVYDAANQLKTKSGARVRSVTYAYNLAGQTTSAIFTGTTEGVYYGYDAAGRLESETSEGPVAGQANYSRKLTFGIDAAGARTSILWPASAGSADYTYDPAGRPEKVKDGSFELATYGYDSLNRRSSLSFGNGTSQTQTWDGASRLDEWDLNLVNTDHNDHRKFGYNAADQMTSDVHAAVYDHTGYAATSGPVADGLNRDAGVALISGYDANQNLINDKLHTFTYDGENRLLTASWPATASLDYDPLGRLRQTTISGTVTQFLYDGDQLVAEYDGAGNLLRRYVHGAGVDDPLVWYEGGARRWLHANRQGSIIAWSDASGVSQATYTYGPYGEPGDNWAAGSRFRYTGQIALPELKLYYYKARAYDPMRGWFLQTDPIGYKDDVNLYAYTGGDPVNKSDPTGLEGATSVLNLTPGGFPINSREGREDIGRMGVGFGNFITTWVYDPRHPVLSVVGFVPIGKVSKPLMIGLEKFGLTRAAEQLGARHLMDSTRIVTDFLGELATHKGGFIVRLDGLAGKTTSEKIANAIAKGKEADVAYQIRGKLPEGSITNWEIYRLSQSNFWKNAIFHEGNKVVRP